MSQESRDGCGRVLVVGMLLLMGFLLFVVLVLEEAL